MSNYKTVFFTLGILQIILGLSMMIPLIIQFIFKEVDSGFISGEADLHPNVVPSQIRNCQMVKRYHSKLHKLMGKINW